MFMQQELLTKISNLKAHVGLFFKSFLSIGISSSLISLVSKLFNARSAVSTKEEYKGQILLAIYKVCIS